MGRESPLARMFMFIVRFLIYIVLSLLIHRFEQSHCQSYGSNTYTPSVIALVWL